MEVSGFLLWASALVLAGALLFYFIPTFIAVLRGHEQKLAIFLLNFFGGITGIAWLVALIWSVMPSRSETAYYSGRGWW